MDHIRRNRHRRRSEWAAAEEEGSSSSRAKHSRLNPVPNTICESTLPLPSFAEGEDTEHTQNVCADTVEPSHSVASEAVEFGKSDIRNVVELDYQDRLLFFACYTVLHGTSTAELGRMMMLIEVVTGRPANITVPDITRFIENLKTDLRLRNYVFCSSCFRTLVNKHSLCHNSLCKLYRIHPKRSKSLRRPSLSLLDIRPQLKTVLATHLSLLINVHRRLQENHFDCGARSNATDFPMFKKNIESSEEFSTHTLILQLTIATDGFIPARLTRQELWPLYLRVDDIPSRIGNNYLNVILAGVLWTSISPHEELWEGLWTHLITELALMNSNEWLQIQDNVTGDKWTIKLRLTHAVVDYKGLQEIFGIHIYIFGILQSAERSRLGTNLFDNIETTRLLVEDAICNRVLVNLLLIKTKDLESQLHALRQICTKHTVGGISESSSMTSFSHDNLKRIHIINHGPPFKELNLNELLAGYAPPGRVKHKTALIINDFLRVIFKQVCGPDPSDIWNFAYRTCNVTRKKDLQDLPEAIVKTLNDFMLDALDLGNEDLQGYRLDAIKSSRSSYWISLGKCEEEREKRFNFLLERKTVYCSQIRICIAEALEDIRYYRFYQGKLVPPKKYKTSQVGFGREDKSRMTKLEWRRQALHMKEI